MDTVNAGDMLNNMKIWKMNQTMKNDNDIMAGNMSMMDSSMMKGNIAQAVNNRLYF
jgi:hypothetical protein